VNCVATETNTHYTLETALTGCGTTARYRKGAVVYSNTVLEIPVKDDAIITRVREIKITRTLVMLLLLESDLIPGNKSLMMEREALQLFWACVQMTSTYEYSYIHRARSGVWSSLAQLRKQQGLILDQHALCMGF